MKSAIHIILVLLLTSMGAMAQSKKQLNKELKVALKESETEYERLHLAFLEENTRLEAERMNIRTKSLAEVELLSGNIVAAREYIVRLESKLKLLGENTEKYIPSGFDYSSPIPGIQELVIKSSSALSSRITWCEVVSSTDLEGVSVKEQNVILQNELVRYSKCKSHNEPLLIKLNEYTHDLKTLGVSLDSLALVLRRMKDNTTPVAYTLKARYEELQADFLKNGPNGYSKAYVAEFGTESLEKKKEKKSPGSSYVRGSEPEVLPTPESERSTVVYEAVEKQAEFPDGMIALREYIKANLVMPESVSSGKVVVKFIISETGRISNIKVVKGIPDCPECDNAAIQLVLGMPNWIPAKNNGQKVSSYFNLPVAFAK